ncbi:GNAT family N-acetyltransferase [Dactylosporangium sp. NPDC051485]|uniref:GNAT family N-acetyltransferase n=1 Tax=Dactylosporangium sp. NPDC051485 TaxID=3154846 RepID=UPI00341D12E9
MRVVTAWETALTGADHLALSALLRAAFPGPEFAPDRSWPASWARKQARIWLADDGGTPVAHLGLDRRLAGTPAGEVLIAGVGDVAVAPGHQGAGLGAELMRALDAALRDGPFAADFGFVQCREAVAGFYARTGWTRVPNPTRHVGVRDGRTVVEREEPTLVRPGRRALAEWPDGLIDLRGLPW